MRLNNKICFVDELRFSDVCANTNGFEKTIVMIKIWNIINNSKEKRKRMEYPKSGYTNMQAKKTKWKTLWNNG